MRARKRRRVESAADTCPCFESVDTNHHLGMVRALPDLYTSSTQLAFSMRLGPDAPRRRYRRRAHETKSLLHWGQRKLLLSEIKFLTEHSFDNATVLYVGAAPGTHILQLMRMFPSLSFELYDPAPFHETLENAPRCTTHCELFCDQTALEYARRSDVLFICDIRTCDYTIHSEAYVQQRVQEDMLTQQRWHEIIQPQKSLLKFRLPWTPGKTEYLAGDLYIQAFAPLTSTDCRLVPERTRKILYDHIEYEERMFYFNTVQRTARYKHTMPVGLSYTGLDYCFDCRAEVDILCAYLNKIHSLKSDEDLQLKFVELSAECSRVISSTRTLSCGNADTQKRLRNIRARQWIDGRPAYLNNQS